MYNYYRISFDVQHSDTLLEVVGYINIGPTLLYIMIETGKHLTLYVIQNA